MMRGLGYCKIGHFGKWDSKKSGNSTEAGRALMDLGKISSTIVLASPHPAKKLQPSNAATTIV
eukprot:scaffold1713_cov145-Skeletonema_menzelii.AAC.5